MAKKKAAKAALRPATWYTNASPGDRARQRDYILDTVLGVRDERMGKRVGGLREFFTGFDASDGYDMRHPENISAQRLRSLKKYGQYLHTLQSQPYTKVVARSRAARTALQDRTGQRLPRQTSYLYHYEGDIPPRVTYKDGVLTERTEVKRGLVVTARFYYFRDFNRGKQPLSINAMVRIYEQRMQDSMPDGFYSLVTDAHGRIDAPVRKKFISDVLRRYAAAYESKEKFAEAILGFQSYRTGDDVDSEYVERVQRRAAAQAAKSWRARQERQTQNFWRMARGLTRKTKRKPGKKRAKKSKAKKR